VPPAEDPAERQRRLYSCGYFAGQWCAGNPPELQRKYRQRVEYAADPFLVGIGVLDYIDGFDDGWHGRVPLYELRIADLAAYEQWVGARAA
jgi:hypothetical protein